MPDSPSWSPLQRAWSVLTERRVLLAVLVVATVVKLALLAPLGDLRLRGDEVQYAHAAKAVATTGSPAYLPWEAWDDGHASPLYPYLLGGVRTLSGGKSFLVWARAVQVLLGSATALLVYLLARRCFDERVAVTSAVGVALFPTLVGYQYFFYTETLFNVLLVATALLLVRSESGPTRAQALWAGVLGGLAALTRSVFVFQAPLVLAWILLGRRTSAAPAPRRWAAAGAFALGMVLVIAPWSLRNTLHHGKFLLIDSNGGNVLFQNWNAFEPENYDIGVMTERVRARQGYQGEIAARERVDEMHLVDRNNAEIRAALRFVVAHPARFLRNCWIRAGDFLNPSSFVARAVRLGDLPTLSPWLGELLVGAVLVSTLALLLFGGIGLLDSMVAGRPLLALLIGSIALPCVLIISMSRYRLPLVPLLMPFAVHAAFHLRTILGTARRRVAAALWLLVLIGVAVHYVPYSYP